MLIALLTGSWMWAQTPCASITVSPYEAPPRQTFELPISILDFENIYVHIVFEEEVTSEHVVNLRLFTPNGHLYQQIDFPVSFSQSRQVASRRVPGYPRPVALAYANSDRSVQGQVISKAIPLAGTSIVQNSIYGMWTVTVDLDFGDKNCADPVVFQVTD